jgi:hypothetical protein
MSEGDSKIGEMEKELERLGVQGPDRERIIELAIEAIIEAERETRLKHGAQILETILGLRFQDDGLGPVGEDRARDRHAAILTMAGEGARSRAEGRAPADPPAGVW